MSGSSKNTDKPGGCGKFFFPDKLLLKKPKGKKCAINDCNNTVGVGNYYLCEAHFKAHSEGCEHQAGPKSTRRSTHL